MINIMIKVFKDFRKRRLQPSLRLREVEGELQTRRIVLGYLEGEQDNVLEGKADPRLSRSIHTELDHYYTYDGLPHSLRKIL